MSQLYHDKNYCTYYNPRIDTEVTVMIFVANKFNRHFCNIAEKLVNKLPLRTYREDRVQDYYIKKRALKEILSNSMS